MMHSEGAPENPSRRRERPGAAAIAVLTLLYAIFVFWGLGAVEFFGDEGLAALGAKRVLQFGYPQGWDGQNLFSLEAGHDLTDGLVQRRMPWLTFYIGAIGQWIFGETNFGARFGFALCGVFNLPLIYLAGRRMRLSRAACVVAPFLLASLAGYFLYIRQAYHYAADITLSLLALICYLRIEKRRNPVLLALCVVGLFHLNYLSALWLAVSLTACALWDGRWRVLIRRRSVWLAASIALAGTYGWIRWARVVEFQDTLGGWSTLLPHWSRLGFVLSELDMSWPLLATVPVLVWCGRRACNDESLRPLFRFAVCASAVLLYLGAHQFAWLRFYLFIFAIFAWVWAAFLAELWVSKRNWAIAIACLMFGTTIPYHLSHSILGAIWPAFGKYAMRRMHTEKDDSRAAQILAASVNPLLFEAPAELAAPPVTHLGEVIHHLNRRAKPGEQIVSLCDSEILQFRTRLITAYLVDPRQSSYHKVSHLPPYITSYHEADWVLLHNLWKRNYGMMELGDVDQNEEILAYFRQSGAVLERVPLRVREHFPNQLPTLWGHTWATDVGAPTVQLYRVHRPGKS
ncbi:MAG: glycosyltransferase family 39 protein [Verrucomicrobia bacterium]|nr:glycosyltransferase family 39 protein [Verrucomicrobiota bacterium]